MTSEIKEYLLSKYKFKFELHAHTSPASACSEISPKELVQIYREHGYAGVVITNHFLHGCDKEKIIYETQLRDFEEAYASGEELGVKVLLGSELRFTESCNDYLLYGADKEVLELVFDYLDKGLEKFRREAMPENSVLIQAHPFRTRSVPAFPFLLDGVEVFNTYPNHNSKIAPAAKLAKENPTLIKTAGSDFHHPLVGYSGLTALRLLTIPSDSFELAKILRSGNYVIEIGDTILLP